MKKQILKSALIALAGVGLMVGNAAALTFGSSGGWNLSSASSTNANFQELLTFEEALIGGTGLTLRLAPFSIDESSSPSPYTFNPSLYTDGFQIYLGNVLQFQADIKIPDLTTVFTAGLINPSFAINLINFDTVVNGNTFIDELSLATSGAITITFNAPSTTTPPTTIDELILSSSPYNDIGATYSLSGAATAVPEPGTMMLFGTGILGLAGIARRRIAT